jgi:acyl dehydratase
MIWAARLPATFPVYPRGATQEAAGTDQGPCALRAVRFVTPVPLGEVIDFYYTRALAAGYPANRARQQGDDRLSGARDQSGYAVWARRLESGNTEVDLVTW